MTEYLVSIPDQLVADYIDREMNNDEKVLFEMVLNIDDELRNYVHQVKRGRNLLRKLPPKRTNIRLVPNLKEK